MPAEEGREGGLNSYSESSGEQKAPPGYRPLWEAATTRQTVSVRKIELELLLRFGQCCRVISTPVNGINSVDSTVESGVARETVTLINHHRGVRLDLNKHTLI